MYVYIYIYIYIHIRILVIILILMLKLILRPPGQSGWLAASPDCPVARWTCSNHILYAIKSDVGHHRLYYHMCLGLLNF